MSQPTADIRRYVSAALTAVLFRRWSDASDFLNEASLLCLVEANKIEPDFRRAVIAAGISLKPRQDVPPPGSLASDYRELASRATDPQAKAHWEQLAQEEASL
jgi:hypothetical protein